MSWPFSPRHERRLSAIIPRPRPGMGTRLTVNMQGVSLSAPTGGITFAHPFRPSLAGTGVTLQLGLVEGRPPTINGVSLKERPRLELDAKVANANGESWVCVEVHPDADGLLPAESKIEIVHTNQVRSIDQALGRGALCLILWRDRRPFRAVAIKMFNLLYERVLPPPGGGVVRHLFR